MTLDKFACIILNQCLRFPTGNTGVNPFLNFVPVHTVVILHSSKHDLRDNLNVEYCIKKKLTKVSYHEIKVS